MEEFVYYMEIDWCLGAVKFELWDKFFGWTNVLDYDNPYNTTLLWMEKCWGVSCEVESYMAYIGVNSHDSTQRVPLWPQPELSDCWETKM